MKLTLVEPFVSRPQVEDVNSSQEVEGSQPIVIKKVDTDLGHEGQSDAEGEAKKRQVLNIFDILAKQKRYQRSSLKMDEKSRVKALSKYIRMTDFQGPLDHLGNRLAKKA